MNKYTNNTRDEDWYRESQSMSSQFPMRFVLVCTNSVIVCHDHKIDVFVLCFIELEMVNLLYVV